MPTMNKNDKGTAEFLKGYEVIPEQSNTFTRNESIVSVFPSAPADPTPAQILGLIEQSTTLEFWAADGEDIYSHDDGQEL